MLDFKNEPVTSVRQMIYTYLTKHLDPEKVVPKHDHIKFEQFVYDYPQRPNVVRDFRATAWTIDDLDLVFLIGYRENSNVCTMSVYKRSDYVTVGGAYDAQ